MGVENIAVRGKFSTVSVKDEKGEIDISFLALVLILLVFGLIMMFSASYANAYYQHDGNSFHYITRQLLFAAIGLVAMVVISRIDYHWMLKWSWPAYLVSVLMLIFVFTQDPINGARRWIDIGFTTFQPSEIAKLAVIMLFAKTIATNDKKMHTFKYGILPFVIILAPVVGLVLMEPHISATVIIVAIAAVMLFVGGIAIRWIVGAVIGGGIAVGVAMLIPSINERAMYRVNIWRDPFDEPLGAGFQTIQSLYAIGSGGLMGTGIGGSRQKYLFIPEPQNDFVYAIICEELGFVGAVLVIILFSLLIWRGFTIALKSKDKVGTMLVTGLTAQVGVQAVLNIAVVTNTVPNTGIGLPFFSYGGTALLMQLVQMGMILSVSRHANMQKE